MTPKRIAAIAGLVLAAAGVLCVALCMFQPGGNQTLMNLGLICTALAFLVSWLLRLKKE